MRVKRAVVGLIVFQLMFEIGLVTAAETKPGWQVEWEKTVEAATKEGQVTVYIGGWVAVIDAGVFQKAYPGKIGRASCRERV